MNKAIAHILKEKLIQAPALPFIEKVAGLVYVYEYNEAEKDPNTQQITRQRIKRIPASCDQAADQCGTMDLVPDSSKRGVVYFEDNGVRDLGEFANKYFQYQSYLRLVAWINLDWIKNVNVCYQASALLMNDIIARLKSLNQTHSGIFLSLQVNVTTIPKADKAIFSPYTYDLMNSNVLYPPFEFFALDLMIEYKIAKSCRIPIESRTTEEYNEAVNCAAT